MTYNSIKVVKGNGGYGGPLVITPTEEKHKFIYITGVKKLLNKKRNNKVLLRKLVWVQEKL